MLRNLAVGIDAGPAAEVPLQQALELATACSGRLHLLAALEGADAGENLLGAPRSIADAALPLEESEEERIPPGIPPYLERARQLCHAEQVPCRLHLHLGNPWPWLRQAALVSDLLVVGTSSTLHVKSARWGGTLRQLLRCPPLPVLVCGRDLAGRRQGLAFYTPDGPGIRALSLCAHLCEALNLPLRVIAAAPRRDTATHWLTQARERLTAYQLNPSFTAYAGPPATALGEAAGDARSSLIALPAHSRRCGSFMRTPLCRAALQHPEAATLVVP